MIEVKPYAINRIDDWNEFLSDSKNQTFLLSRNYMDYHADRFTDFSIMVYEDTKLVALLPANLHDKTSIVSHAGLTYGGFAVKRDLRSIKTVEYFYHTLKYLSEHGIETFHFKQIPSFYNDISGDELDYALFLIGALLYRADIAFAVRQGHTLPWQERRLRSIKKAQKLSVDIVQELTFNSFWNEILTPNLLSRFGVSPVHSLKEISELAEKNSPHIKQFNAYLDDRLVAGTTIYETRNTAHAQYISASEEGRKSGALDLLFYHLITSYYSHKDFFDFGIVNEENGKRINKGLLDWKEGFGARAYAHRFFQIKTENYISLKHVIE